MDPKCVETLHFVTFYLVFNCFFFIPNELPFIISIIWLSTGHVAAFAQCWGIFLRQISITTLTSGPGY